MRVPPSWGREATAFGASHPQEFRCEKRPPTHLLITFFVGDDLSNFGADVAFSLRDALDWAANTDDTIPVEGVMWMAAIDGVRVLSANETSENNIIHIYF